MQDSRADKTGTRLAELLIRGHADVSIRDSGIMKSKGHRYHGASHASLAAEQIGIACESDAASVIERERYRATGIPRDAARHGSVQIAGSRARIIDRASSRGQRGIIPRSREGPRCDSRVFAMKSGCNDETRARSERQSATDLYDRVAEKRAFAESSFEECFACSARVIVDETLITG